jgi:hypothetical protein
VSDRLHVPAALQLRRKAGTHKLGRWVDSRIGLNGFGGEKLSFLRTVGGNIKMDFK